MLSDFIDKVAWVRVENGRVLSTRSRGKDTYYLPVDKIIFDWLLERGVLR
jgi:8-oxo-dGTP diphosphatase